jgi:hypothetical protein
MVSAPPVVIGEVLIAEKTHLPSATAGALLVVCFVHTLPAVSDMVDCVEQTAEVETNVCTDTTSTLFTPIALVVITEAVEHGAAVQKPPPVCTTVGEANAGTALIGSDRRAINASKEPGRSTRRTGPYRFLPGTSTSQKPNQTNKGLWKVGFIDMNLGFMSERNTFRCGRIRESNNPISGFPGRIAKRSRRNQIISKTGGSGIEMLDDFAW